VCGCGKQQTGFFRIFQKGVEKLRKTSPLKQLMKEKNLTQTQISEETGIAPSTLSSVIKGRRELSLNSIKKLCKKYKLSLDFFIDINVKT